MGIRVWKNERGEVMIQGIPNGYWVFITFGILFYIIGWPILLAGGGIPGTILISIGTIFLFSAKFYGNSKRKKKLVEYHKLHDSLAKQESDEFNDREEYEAFKRWRKEQNK